MATQKSFGGQREAFIYQSAGDSPMFVPNNDEVWAEQVRARFQNEVASLVPQQSADVSIAENQDSEDLARAWAASQSESHQTVPPSQTINRPVGVSRQLGQHLNGGRGVVHDSSLYSLSDFAGGRGDSLSGDFQLNRSYFSPDLRSQCSSHLPMTDFSLNRSPRKQQSNPRSQFIETLQNVQQLSAVTNSRVISIMNMLGNGQLEIHGSEFLPVFGHTEKVHTYVFDEERIKMFDSHPEPYKAGLAMSDRGSIMEAVAALECAAKRDPNDNVWLSLARLFVELDDDEKALAAFFQVSDNNSQSWIGRAICYSNLECPDVSVACLWRWWLTWPSVQSTIATRSAVPMNAESLYAVFSVVAGQVLRAENTEAFVDIYVACGLCSLIMRDVFRAIHWWKCAVSLNPLDLSLQNQLAAVSSLGGLNDSAIEILNEVVRVRVEHVRGHANLGMAYANMGSLEEAIQCFAHGLHINPRAYKIWKQLEIVCAGLGLKAISRKALNKDISVISDINDYFNQ